MKRKNKNLKAIAVICIIGGTMLLNTKYETYVNLSHFLSDTSTEIQQDTFSSNETMLHYAGKRIISGIINELKN